jgi:predicted RNase H-like HicB family nuclease
MSQRVFTVILHQEGNRWVADCPEVGTVSQGPSIDEALANLREATELYLEEWPLPEETRTLLTTFEARVSSPVIAAVAPEPPRPPSERPTTPHTHASCWGGRVDLLRRTT